MERYPIDFSDEQIKMLVDKAVELAKFEVCFKMIAVEILETFEDLDWAKSIKNECKMRQNLDNEITPQIKKQARKYFDKFRKIVRKPLNKPFEKLLKIIPVMTDYPFLDFEEFSLNYDWFGDDWSFLEWQLVKDGKHFNLIPPYELYDDNVQNI